MKLKELLLRATEHNLPLVEYLLTNGFAIAPGSMHFHGVYPGGLGDHSQKVMEYLVEFTEKMNLTWQKERSPYLVGLLHDVCKIDYFLWDEEEGKYQWNLDASFEHGEKSVKILTEYLELTEEEAMCIRWHMGAFDEKENWIPYSDAVGKYPNVLWTHAADMLAAKVDKI